MNRPPIHSKLVLIAALGGPPGALLLAAPAESPPAAPPPAIAPAPPEAPPAFAAPAPELVLPTDLVTVQRGTLPIIISAPHGGSVRVAGSKDRTRGVVVRDVNTAELALLVAQRLTDRLGGKPYVVVAQFSRRDADANRPPAPESDEAYETPAARAQYEAYHRALAACVAEVRARHGGVGLLVDLHGQARAPEAVVRGTRNGRAVSALIARAGVGAVTGPTSVMGALHARGHPVLPTLTTPATPDEAAARGDIDADGKPDGQWLRREPFFDGGYITERYGSHRPDGIDAIQLEVGAQRSNDLLGFSRDLGDAIEAFARAHLPVR
jgi:N-formylglutamate amidohydrolase